MSIYDDCTANIPEMLSKHFGEVSFPGSSFPSPARS